MSGMPTVSDASIIRAVKSGLNTSPKLRSVIRLSVSAMRYRLNLLVADGTLILVARKSGPKPAIYKHKDM